MKVWSLRVEISTDRRGNGKSDKDDNNCFWRMAPGEEDYLSRRIAQEVIIKGGSGGCVTSTLATFIFSTEC